MKKQPKMEKKYQEFCRYCGEKLIVTKVAASRIKVTTYGFGDVYTSVLDENFDRYTGNIIMAEVRTCPLYESDRKWWRGNNHDRIVIHKDDWHFVTSLK